MPPTIVWMTYSSISSAAAARSIVCSSWRRRPHRISMVRDTATLITFGDVTPLLPAIAIAWLTVGVNFVVDWKLHQASGLKS